MILTAITFLIILTILVLIHELGHFLVARMIGVRVEEFGLGLPPRIWGKKFGDTIYSLNWLPIGGFVRLAGEDKDPDDSAKVKPSHLKEYFWARSKKERSAILVAGVFMNFVLAIAITMVLLLIGIHETAGRIHIENVVTNSPAEKVGLKANDIIRSAAVIPDAPKTMVVPSDLTGFVKEHAGQELALIVERDGKIITVRVVPRTTASPGEGLLGVAISDIELHKYPPREVPGKALSITAGRVREMVGALGTAIGSLVKLRAPEADVAGPIGIAQVTGIAVKLGLRAVLELASILSLNLALLNILPIPALDGGRLMFVFLEKMLGKKVRPAFERSTHQIGMLILLGLIVLVSINDILRLVRG